MSGSVVLTLGLLAWATGAPILAPPLGVSVYSALRDPRADSNRPRSIVVGHLAGLVAGAAALAVTGAAALPGAATSFSLQHAVSSALAIAATAWTTERVGAPHPPALATTLVVSLGILPSWTAGGALLVGAIVIASGVLATSRFVASGRGLLP